MTTIGLELCDAGILAALSGGGKCDLIPLEGKRITSPAFVFYHDDAYICGAEAEKLNRLYPRNVSDAAWNHLSLKPSDIRAEAKIPLFSELAFHHFQHVWRNITEAVGDPDKVVLALPGEYLAGDAGDEEKIGLVLGMADHLRIPLAGLVDLACASVVHMSASDNRTAASETAFHLDLHQHSCVLTVLEKGESVKRKAVWSTSSLGYADLLGEMLPKLANLFLRQTSFDITHSIETEQDFYNQTVGLLRRLQKAPEAILEIGSQRRPRKMVASRDLLARLIDRITTRLVESVQKAMAPHSSDGGIRTLYLTERATRVPGLSEKLEHSGDFRMIRLPEGAAAFGAVFFGENAEVIGDLSMCPVTVDMPVRSQRDEGDRSALLESGGAAAPAAEGGLPGPIEEKTINGGSEETEFNHSVPTHIIYQGTAYALDASPFFLGRSIPGPSQGIELPSTLKSIAEEHCRIVREENRLLVENPSSLHVSLNDEPVAKTSILKAGDELELGDEAERVRFVLVKLG